MPMPDTFFGRRDEMSRLQSFVDSEKSGFLVLRGRRRIGKSWLLRKFVRKVSAFSFQGDGDSSSKQLMKKMADEWSRFSGDDTLSVIRIADLSWVRVFRAMTAFFRAHDQRTHVLVFDRASRRLFHRARNSSFLKLAAKASRFTSRDLNPG